MTGLHLKVKGPRNQPQLPPNQKPEKKGMRKIDSERYEVKYPVKALDEYKMPNAVISKPTFGTTWDFQKNKDHNKENKYINRKPKNKNHDHQCGGPHV
jgi:hypothetical protein